MENMSLQETTDMAERKISRNPAREIAMKFGGATPLSIALGHAHASTVQSWIDKGWIPMHRQQSVIDAGIAEGIDIKPEEFVSHLDVPIRSRGRPKKTK